MKFAYTIVLLLFLTSCVGNDRTEWVKMPDDLEGVISMSSSIIVAEVISESKEVQYIDETYYLSNVKVNQILRSPSDEILESIYIFQSENDLLNINAGDNIIIFGNALEFPEYEHVYRPVSYNNGLFVLNDKGNFIANLENHKNFLVDCYMLEELLLSYEYNKELLDGTKKLEEDILEDRLIKELIDSGEAE